MRCSMTVLSILFLSGLATSTLGAPIAEFERQVIYAIISI
jgi:hypothetical protein